jgi:hypothetical protein
LISAMRKIGMAVGLRRTHAGPHFRSAGRHIAADEQARFATAARVSRCQVSASSDTKYSRGQGPAPDSERAALLAQNAEASDGKNFSVRDRPRCRQRSATNAHRELAVMHSPASFGRRGRRRVGSANGPFHGSPRQLPLTEHDTPQNVRYQPGAGRAADPPLRPHATVRRSPARSACSPSCSRPTWLRKRGATVPR